MYQTEKWLKKNAWAGLVTAALVAGCVVSAPYSAPSAPLEVADRSLYLAADYSQELKAFLDSGKTLDEAVEAAKAVVAYDLKDPESARFRSIEIRDFQGGKLICGEVNAKNSYGGYVGYQKFLASNLHAMMRSVADARRSTSWGETVAIDEACGDPVSENIDTYRCPPDVIGRMREAGASDSDLLRSCGRR